METRVAIIAIVVEDDAVICDIQNLLSEYSEYIIEFLGNTSSFFRYVHLFVILFINFSAVASSFTISEKFHGRIFSFEFLIIQENLLLLFILNGPT